MANLLDEKISVIIRTFNEALYIENLLRSIKHQNYSNLEIILVASESTDNTIRLAEPFCDKIVKIKKKDFTFGYSLNKGIENSTGDYLVLVSAHTHPTSNQWIKTLIKPLQNPQIKMVYGKQSGDTHSWYPEFRDMMRTFPNRSKILNAPNYFSHNANSALRKSDWDNYHFNDFLPGQEDIEWAKFWMDKGFSVYYEPCAEIIHSHKESWEQIYRRFLRESQAMTQIGVLNKLSIAKICLRESLSVLLDCVSRMTSPKITESQSGILRYRIIKIIASVHGIVSK